MRIILWLLTLVLAIVVCGAIWLAVAPPALIRVASAYSAKIVCSNVFIAGRDAEQVLADDVQAPGHWLLKYIRLDVNREAKSVSAGLLGVFGKGTAVARDGLGCTSVPDGAVASLAKVSLPAVQAAPAGLWPEGEEVQPSQDPKIAAILDDAALGGPGMRAIIVVQNGRIVGERYGAGFDAATPQLGWSMTKSVNAALIGAAVKAGKMTVDMKGFVERWNGDGRANITVADLMAMSSGLEFNEDYGDVTDVTSMLFLKPDMAAFASDKPLTGEIGKVFNYSSGTATLLSRVWQNAVGADAALTWPRQLFEPLGMRSAVLEVDEKGTFVGSSYMYATPRDWARFGQFMLNGGTWNGAQILPPGFVAWMTEDAPASKGLYARGQIWAVGPGDDPAFEASSGVPADAYWFLGHDGQSVAVVPSSQLVVVRLGLTPSRLNYRPEPLVGSLVKAFAP